VSIWALPANTARCLWLQ